MIDFDSIPNNPGCYLFKNKKKQVIYVGKAKNLKKRVKSYFQKTNQDEKTKALVDNIVDVDFIVTFTEVEALILENNLIKKHYPKYNVNLKDGKRYAYIRLTDEKYPRLVIARNKKLPGKYFGPFVSALTRDYIMKTLIKVFQIRTCKKLPKRECLRYHIGLCSGPCTDQISEKDYNFNLRSAELVLRGETKDLLSSLKQKMEAASKNTEYETALRYKNQVDAINWLNEKQTMERKKNYDEDIINYIIKNGKVYLILFNVYKGILENKQEFEFQHNNKFLEEFLIQYYTEHPVPKEIILPVKIDSALIDFLAEKRGKKLSVVAPKIGEKKKLLKLVIKNIEISFFSNQEKLEDLQNKLKLNELPEVIECFDISHLSGTSTVGSMVQFRRSKPDKNNYRRFRIRTVEGIDDFASIAEVVKRRYSRLVNENQELPNLIVIDGGKGQLSAAIEELRDLNLRIPIIGLAKKFEEIYVPGLRAPIHLDKKSKALKLLQEIRDEAHRFAISYNRLLRIKKIKEEK